MNNYKTLRSDIISRCKPLISYHQIEVQPNTENQTRPMLIWNLGEGEIAKLLHPRTYEKSVATINNIAKWHHMNKTPKILRPTYKIVGARCVVIE